MYFMCDESPGHQRSSLKNVWRMKAEDNHPGPLSVCAEASSPGPPGVHLSPCVQVLSAEAWVKSWQQTCRFEAQLQFLHLQRSERRQPEQTSYPGLAVSRMLELQSQATWYRTMLGAAVCWLSLTSAA